MYPPFYPPVVQMMPPPQQPGNGLATTSMILGIVSLSLVVLAIPFFIFFGFGLFLCGVGFIGSVVGLALGGVGLQRAKAQGGVGKESAVAGITMNVIPLALTSLIALCGLCGFLGIVGGGSALPFFSH